MNNEHTGFTELECRCVREGVGNRARSERRENPEGDPKQTKS